MTYAELESLMERLALDALEGSGHFHCGGSDSLKEAVEENGYPVIHLDPIDGNRNIARGSKRANIAIGFFEQGEAHMAAADLQAIYGRQEVVSARFLTMLQEEDEVGDILDVRDTKVQSYTDQILTGLACSFTIKLPISLCS